MDPLELRQVSVWLDDLAPEAGAFAHALEWSARLELPLRGALTCPIRTGGRLPADDDRLRACTAACERRGVRWDVTAWHGPWSLDVDRFLGAGGLCVFGEGVPPALKDELLRRSLLSDAASVLVCPRPWVPVSRVLVVDQHGERDRGFLAAAALLCRGLRAQPVVLTVARTEREARARQRLAEGAFAALRQPAAFDYIVGWEVRTAVMAVARWRRCGHVFLERRNAPPWWRWLHGDPLPRLLGLSDGLTFLALAGGSRPRPAAAEFLRGAAAGARIGTARRPEDG